jgi:hypothetical protein
MPFRRFHHFRPVRALHRRQLFWAAARTFVKASSGALDSSLELNGTILDGNTF